MLACASANAFNLEQPSRRNMLKALGTAGLVSSFPLPTHAKSKRSLVVAESEAAEKARIAEVTGIKAGAGGKGLRGDASAMDKVDTVQKNRLENSGVARDANGKKIATANRNRPPEELGLKQWGGN